MTWTSPSAVQVHMKHFLSVLAILSLALPLAGFKPGEEKVAKSAEEKLAKSDVEKAVDITESLATAAVANKGDCDKMGDAFKAIVSGNANLFKRLKAKAKTQTEAEQKAAMKDYEPRLEAAMKKMMKPAMKCAKNQKVKGAFDSL